MTVKLLHDGVSDEFPDHAEGSALPAPPRRGAMLPENEDLGPLSLP